MLTSYHTDISNASGLSRPKTHGAESIRATPQLGIRNAEFIRHVWIFPPIPSFHVPRSAFDAYSDSHIDSCDYAALSSRLLCSS